MKFSEFVRKEWLQLLILIAPFVIAAVVWEQLPARIPTHWNLHGEPNGYSDKETGLFLLPLINIVVASLLMSLSGIDPKAAKMKLPPDAMRKIRFVLTSLLLILFIFSVEQALNVNVNLNVMMHMTFYLFLLLMGNYFPKIKPNYFIGIRTPWSLEDSDNWRRTHQFAGRVWMLVAVIGGSLEFLLPQPFADSMFFGCILIIAFVPIAYSFWLWIVAKRNARNGAANSV